MRKSLATLLAVCLISTCAAALEVDFNVTKDAGILGAGGEDASNAGGASSARCVKWRQHSVLMDFDWDGIAAEIAAQETAGNAFVKAELRLTEAYGSLEGVAFAINAQYLESNSTGDLDWDEGTGQFNYANYNWDWVTGGMAATSHSPSTTYDGTTEGNDGDNWIWGGNHDYESFWNYRNNAMQNSQLAIFAADGESSTVVMVELDMAMLEEQAQADIDGDGFVVEDGYSAPGIPCGIYTYDKMSFGSNGAIYLDDQNASVAPMIKLTFVPEPATMSLLVIGAGALLRKKR